MTSLDVIGHSYSTGDGVTSGQKASSLFATHVGAVENNKGVSGALITAEEKGEQSGGFPWIANKLVRNAAAPFARAVDYGIVWYGLNDIAFMDSTFSTRAQEILSSNFLFGISRMVAGHVYNCLDASLTYSGFSTNENSEGSGTGTSNKLATSNGSTVTFTIPEGFSGGTIAMNFTGVCGLGAVFSFKVDGVAAGTLDTRMPETITPGPGKGEATMFCQRIKGLTAAAAGKKAVATVGSISTACVFDSVQIEAPTPPTTLVMGQFKLPTTGYTSYSEIGAFHTPTDANIETLQSIQKAAAESFPSQVKFVSLASMDKTAKIQSEGIHPTAEGHAQIAELMYAQLPAEARLAMVI